MPDVTEDPLASLPESDRAPLLEAGLDLQRLRQHMARVRSEAPEDNFVRGTIAAPEAHEIESLPPRGSQEYGMLERRGLEALEAGQVALVVLAGGMATRMGGVIKALVDACPARASSICGAPRCARSNAATARPPPLWLMTSHSTDEGIRAALGDDAGRRAIATFHATSLASPDARRRAVFSTTNGQPSEHAPGHGDLPDALQRSGLLEAFVAARRQGDDDDQHRQSRRHPGPGDHRLSPAARQARDLRGRRQAGSGPRRHPGPRRRHAVPCSKSFASRRASIPTVVRVFNTNVFHFDAQALPRARHAWTFFTVNKKVDGQPVRPVRAAGERSHLRTCRPRTCTCRARATVPAFCRSKTTTSSRRGEPEIMSRRAKRGESFDAALSAAASVHVARSVPCLSAPARARRNFRAATHSSARARAQRRQQRRLDRTGA